MNTYLPYIVSIACAIISGVFTYLVARRQTKIDMQKLEKQYSLDLEKERERFEMEKEKMKMEQRFQIELLQKKYENSLGESLTSTLIGEALKSPEVQKEITKGISEGFKRKK